MKNFNTTLILVWILFSFILVIENMIVPLRSYVFIWNLNTWVLAVAGIMTWIVIGYGIKGKMTEQPQWEDDSFDF